MTYEYQLRALDQTEHLPMLQSYLDEAAAESWELYQMLPKMIVFRRNLPDAVMHLNSRMRRPLLRRRLP